MTIAESIVVYHSEAQRQADQYLQHHPTGLYIVCGVIGLFILSIFAFVIWNFFSIMRVNNRTFRNHF